MFHLIQKISKRLWAPLSIFAIVVSLLGTALFIAPSVHAADAAPKSGGCVGNGVSTGLSSPFSQTKDMCLGDEGSSGRRFFQFAIKLDKAVSNVTVTAKSGGGTSISFVKQSDTLYVSKPDSNSLGYAGFVLGTSPGCNATDKNNIITISTKGPTNTDVQTVNLCSYKGDASQSLIYKTATTLQDASGGATASTGTIRGNLHITRTDPLVPANFKDGALEKDFIISLELSGGPTSIKGGNTVAGVKLTNGMLEIPSIAPGTYTLKFTYNDRAAISNDGGDAGWSSTDVAYSFTDIKVFAGKDVWIGNSSETTPYTLTTDSTGVVVAPDQANDTTSCAIEGVGWIVCPVVGFLAKLSDGAFWVIKQFLVVDTHLFNTNSGTYTAWSAFRNIANVAFVIVFMIIIYSQLTGTGVSNYGIKKTLPRLIVAAVLVNVSFFVCQLAVDLTQIIGGSLNNFLQTLAPVPASTDAGASITTMPTSFGDIFGDILAGSGVVLALGATVAAGASILALSVSIPLLLAFLLAVLMTVIILVGRQAAIVILIMLSPLAFVAYLLPNTEQWFKKWYKAFIALLMVYPIVALLYGGGALVSNIMVGVAENSTGPDKFWLSLIAISIAGIPLIMTPSLLKGALNGMGSIGGKLSGMASKANGKVGGVANASRYGEAKQGLKNRFALRRAESRGRSSRQQTIDNSRIGKALGLNKGAARALKAVDQEQDGEVEARITQIQHETSSVNRVQESSRMLKEAIRTGDVTTARAAQKILLSSGTVGVSTLQEVYSDKGIAATMANDKSGTTGFLRSEVNAAGLKGKNNALARWGYEGPADALANGYTKEKTNPDGTVTKTPIQAYARDASTIQKLNAVELAGQTITNLRSGAEHITAESAAAVLNNSAAASLLDGEKRKLFTDIANSATASSGSTARQRAEQTIATAAQGTAGTAPIIVNGSGVSTVPTETISITHDNSSQPSVVPPTTPASQSGSATDTAGRQTPTGATDDYHDRMSR